MTSWSYKVYYLSDMRADSLSLIKVESGNGPKEVKSLDELGQEGWELAGVHNPSSASNYAPNYFIFKKPIYD